MTPVTIALTGDILPTRPLLAERAAPSPGVEEVLAVLRDHDVAVGNFEMPLTSRGEPREKLLAIRANPYVGRDHAVLGLDVATVANNHSLAYGWEGHVDTKDALVEAGFRPIGAGLTLAEAARPAVVDVAGTRVGVLAFSCLLPTGAAAANGRRGLNPIHVETSYEIDSYYQMEEPGDPSVVTVRTRVRPEDQAFAESCIRRLRRDVDALVVSLHWGFGSGEQLADYQQPLGRALIDAGADVVHGHHPHAVHPVEIYRGKPIFYGLGTLVGQQTFLDASPAVRRLWEAMSPDGCVALLDIEGEECAVRALPTSLNLERLAQPARGEKFERIVERLRRLCAGHGTEVAGDGQQLLFTPAGTASESVL
jgi:poly-gamma-glutamate capsule biosynthesis protein CapA/YwtB (metallophosphatase superfamily)